MVDEERRVEEVRTDTGAPVERRETIVRERSGGGAGWIVVIVLIALVVLGVLFFQSESNKNDAIGNAANQVGEAAGQVGDAAQDAANNLQQ